MQAEPALEEIRAAVRAGNLGRISELVRAGHSIRYTNENGYDAMIDAVCSAVRDDDRLLDLLRLLIGYGVDLNGVSRYAESAVRVLSHIGRFDAVRLLLEAGADEGLLAWTPLHRAVALGTIDDVRSLLDTGSHVEAQDWWERTPFLLALLVGDLTKIALLRDRGANVNARGRCDRPPMFYAIEGHHPHVLQWLIEHGQDIEQRDEFDATPLIEAVTHGDALCVQMLLAGGANLVPSERQSALRHARSADVIERLLAAGADPGELSHEQQRTLLQLPEIDESPLKDFPRDAFLRGRSRRFGSHNPERMSVPFWDAMVRSGVSAYQARTHFEAGSFDDEPVWCAARFGQTLTRLPDGRAVQIAGEHEDYYDPDFCIYNDVFVGVLIGRYSFTGIPKTCSRRPTSTRLHWWVSRSTSSDRSATAELGAPVRRRCTAWT